MDRYAVFGFLSREGLDTWLILGCARHDQAVSIHTVWRLAVLYCIAPIWLTLHLLFRACHWLCRTKVLARDVESVLSGQLCLPVR